MRTNLPRPPRQARGVPAPILGLATLLSALLVTTPLQAATVTLQQGVYGYTGAADAWLDESAETRNYGGSTSVQVKYNSGMSDCTLLQFALPSLVFQNLTGATLGLYYYDQSSMTTDNALWITPYRITNNMSWFENSYDGVAGHGVNWRYRDDAQTLPWTGQYGAWYDKIDDGNQLRKIKKPEGSVPDAIAPPAWVTWNVLNSVAQWYGGAQNHGLVMYQSGYEGSGSILAGMFYSREYGITGSRPYLSISYAGAQISWSGTGNANWDTTSATWNVGGYRGSYGNGDFVTFADGASNPGIVVAGGGVLPGAVTVSNTSTAYTFSGGSIGGSGGVTKAGSGTATFSAANGYSGLTIVKAGTLVVAANNALGTTGSGTVVSNGAALGFQGGVNYASAEQLTISGGGGGGGALCAVSGNNMFAGPVTLAADSIIDVASSLDLALNGPIGGGFGLTKTGAGRLAFGGTAPCTYSGGTFVTQGTLALGGLATITTTPVIAVAAGATLDVSAVSGGFILGATTPQTLKGDGTVNGDVIAQGTARLEPGASPGTLTFLNSLTLGKGVTNYFELTNSVAIGGGTNDLVVVGGDLTAVGNVIAITVLGTDPLGGGVYRLFNYAGAKIGSFNPAPVFLGGGPVPGSMVWIDESVTNQVNLVIVAPIATTTLASSAPNPSLPGANVTLMATVSPVPPATNVPTGTFTFRTNGVPLGPPVPLLNGVATLDTAALPHGFTTVWAEYPEQGLFLGSTGSVVQLVNTPPVPGYHVAYVMQNEELVLPVAELLAGDHDPDGDHLDIIHVSSLSTNGGTAALVAGPSVAYLPRPDYAGADLITYTLRDPYTTVTGSIHIAVLSVGDLTNSIISITNSAAGEIALTCTGIPGRTYWLQAVTNLAPPYFWHTLSTNIAGTNGLCEFTDRHATNPASFYRAAPVTNPPAFQMYDTELLQLDVRPMPGMMIRESPTLASPGLTRAELQDTGVYAISSFFDVFTELSLDGGIMWFPATNGSIPLILVGGAPLNEFPNDWLPPLTGQYLSPPEWPELYPQDVIIKNLALHAFNPSFPPPPPGASKKFDFSALVDLWVSLDGGQTFLPFTVPGQVSMRVTGRVPEP